MYPETEVIFAQVSANYIHKADRIFRNNDDGVFVEVLQNARRAGATCIQIQIEEVVDSKPLSRITVHDDWAGIMNFQNLVLLGDSGWDDATKQKEDPADIGFYSLCHSVVHVASGTRATQFNQAAFLGNEPVVVRGNQPYVNGTRIDFTRPSTLSIHFRRSEESGFSWEIFLDTEGPATTRDGGEHQTPTAA
jgi:hypothetical protein